MEPMTHRMVPVNALRVLGHGDVDLVSPRAQVAVAWDVMSVSAPRCTALPRRLL